MYKIKTKQGVDKLATELTQKEVEEAITFNNIKKRQKEEKIQQAKIDLERLKSREQSINRRIIDLGEKKDEVQRLIDEKLTIIDDETHKQKTLDRILSTLGKEYSAQAHLTEFAFDIIETIQTDDYGS